MGGFSHYGGVPGADDAVSAGAGPGHGGVLRVGAIPGAGCGERELELLANTGSAQPAPEEEQPARPEEIESGEASAQKLQLAEAAVEMARYYEDARKLAGMVATVGDVAAGAAASVTW